MAHRHLALCAALCVVPATPAFSDEPIAKIEGDLPDDLREVIERNLEIVEDPARSRAQAKRRLERTAEAVRAVLHSRGYYDPDLQGRVDEAAPKADPGKSPPLKPVLTVVPGVRYTVGDARVRYVEPIPEGEEAADQLDLPSGEPAEADRIVAAGLRVTNWLEQHGYPEADLGNRKITLDHDRDALDVEYPVTTGPKVRIGRIIRKGDANVSPKWVELIDPFEDGELFDERQLDKLTSRVVGTGVFGQAVATLEDEGTTNADGTITRNVILDIEQGPKNTVSGSVGFSTTEGSGVEVIYERRNFIGHAQTATVRAVARTNEIGAGLDYRVPYFMKVERDLNMAISAQRLDTEAFEGENAEARAIIGERVSDRLNVALGVGVEASRFVQRDRDGVASPEREAYIADVIGQALYDRRNNRLNPTKGFLLSAEAVPSYNFGEDSAFFNRVEVGGSAYRRVSDQFVLAGKLELGTNFGADLDQIPFNRRFYAGGGGSVRGFEYQSIGPRDATDEPTGGRSLVAGSAEVRWRSQTLFDGNLGGAVFVDAATIAEPSLADFRDIRYGAGVGVRYFTGFAPMRLDVAVPLNPRDGDPFVQVYISIGQAF